MGTYVSAHVHVCPSFGRHGRLRVLFVGHGGRLGALGRAALGRRLHVCGARHRRVVSRVPHAQVLAPSEYDLGKFYAAQPDMTVLAYPRRITPEARWPLAVANCVGMVKSLLGVSAPLAFTPWQLYMRLRDNGAMRYQGEPSD